MSFVWGRSFAVARLCGFVVTMALGFATGDVGWFVPGACFGLAGCLRAIE